MGIDKYFVKAYKHAIGIKKFLMLLITYGFVLNITALNSAHCNFKQVDIIISKNQALQI